MAWGPFDEIADFYQEKVAGPINRFVDRTFESDQEIIDDAVRNGATYEEVLKKLEARGLTPEGALQQIAEANKRYAAQTKQMIASDPTGEARYARKAANIPTAPRRLVSEEARQARAREAHEAVNEAAYAAYIAKQRQQSQASPAQQPSFSHPEPQVQPQQQYRQGGTIQPPYVAPIPVHPRDNAFANPYGVLIAQMGAGSSPGYDPSRWDRGPGRTPRIPRMPAQPGGGGLGRGRPSPIQQLAEIVGMNTLSSIVEEQRRRQELAEQAEAQQRQQAADYGYEFGSGGIGGGELEGEML